MIWFRLRGNRTMSVFFLFGFRVFYFVFNHATIWREYFLFEELNFKREIDDYFTDYRSRERELVQSESASWRHFAHTSLFRTSMHTSDLDALMTNLNYELISNFRGDF